MVLEKTIESPLDCRENQPVHSKGDQSWVFFGRNDAKAETPILWPPHVMSWLIGKNSDAGRDWGQEEKGTTEDEMAGWHHRLNVHEFEWTPEVGDGQGGLVCCNSWGHKESDMTERLNWTELREGSHSVCDQLVPSSLIGLWWGSRMVSQGLALSFLPSLVAQMVKRLFTMRQTRVQSLRQEVPWRRKRQSTPVLLLGKSHGRRSLVSMGLQRVGHNWATSLSFLRHQEAWPGAMC